MKTKNELYQKVRLTPRVPRVVPKSNSQIGLQDQREQDTRTSSGSTSTWETGSNTVDYRILGVPLSAVEHRTSSGSTSTWETRSNTVDYRILGVPLSAVEQQDTENHPNKESFLQDFKLTKEIIGFSKESQDLIADMNNTEIFELCETSSKQQCPDFATYSGKQALSIVHGVGAKECRGMRRRSTRTTTMSCRYPAVLSRRIASAEPVMDLLKDQESITRPEKCYTTQVKRNMENTHPFL